MAFSIVVLYVALAFVNSLMLDIPLSYWISSGATVLALAVVIGVVAGVWRVLVIRGHTDLRIIERAARRFLDVPR